MKKLLCALLAAVLLFTSLAFTSSASQTELPLVIVRGMDFLHGLSYDTGLPSQREAALNISFTGVMKALYKTFGAFVTNGFSKRAAVGEIISFAREVFDAYAMTPDGESLDPNVSSVSYPASSDHYPEFDTWRDSNEEGLLKSAMARYGKENVYFFKYDWRLDAGVNAVYLHETIEKACADHGCEKVDLICCSMGGLVTLTYLNDYGDSRIDSLVSDASAMGGAVVATELLQKQVFFDEGAAYRFLVSKLPQVRFLWTFLYRTGVVRSLCNFLNRFAQDYLDEIYDGVLTPTFGSMPALWELVQPEVYETAKEIIFGDNAGDYAGLLEKTDRVQREVVSRRQEILDRAKANGMKFSVVAGYNTPLTPAYPGAVYQGDGTLETSCMSLGAKTSVVGETLPEEDLDGDPAFISPDGCVNANTALYRDATWFVKDVMHVGCIYNSEYTMLLFRLLEAETQPTIHTWSEYPQFLVADENENLSVLQ